MHDDLKLKNTIWSLWLIQKHLGLFLTASVRSPVRKTLRPSDGKSCFVAVSGQPNFSIHGTSILPISQNGYDSVPLKTQNYDLLTPFICDQIVNLYKLYI